LRAEKVIAAGFSHFKPFHRVFAGHDIDLGAKRRHEEVVNYIFRRHDQFDLSPDRDVQFVDFALTGRMLKLPHPLFTDDVDLERIFRWPVLFEIDFGTPDKEAERNQKWNYRPKRLKLG